MEKVLICPYCNYPQWTHELDEISASMCYTECENCGRDFWYSVEVTRNYSARKEP